jgi:translation initiation factor IF-1
VPRENAIRLEGRVVEALLNGTFRVELANGHRLLAFGARRLREALAGLKHGRTVILEMTPCDMSIGRIVETDKQT